MRSIVTLVSAAFLAASLAAPVMAATSSSIHHQGVIHLEKHKKHCKKCQKN